MDPLEPLQAPLKDNSFQAFVSFKGVKNQGSYKGSQRSPVKELIIYKGSFRMGFC